MWPSCATPCTACSWAATASSSWCSAGGKDGDVQLFMSNSNAPIKIKAPHPHYALVPLFTYAYFLSKTSSNIIYWCCCCSINIKINIKTGMTRTNTSNNMVCVLFIIHHWKQQTVCFHPDRMNGMVFMSVIKYLLPSLLLFVIIIILCIPHSLTTNKF